MAPSLWLFIFMCLVSVYLVIVCLSYFLEKSIVSKLVVSGGEVMSDLQLGW